MFNRESEPVGGSWRDAAIATVEAVLGRLERGVEAGTLLLPRAHDWETAVTFDDIEDLREHLAVVAHNVWASCCEWDEGGPLEECDVLAIVDGVLLDHAERLRAMGLGGRGSSSGL